MTNHLPAKCHSIKLITSISALHFCWHHSVLQATPKHKSRVLLQSSAGVHHHKARDLQSVSIYFFLKSRMSLKSPWQLLSLFKLLYIVHLFFASGLTNREFWLKTWMGILWNKGTWFQLQSIRTYHEPTMWLSETKTELPALENKKVKFFVRFNSLEWAVPSIRDLLTQLKVSMQYW